MKPSSLVIGRTYFRLTFADRDLTMPGVEPMVFLGEVTDEGGKHGFVFPASKARSSTKTSFSISWLTQT